VTRQPLPVVTTDARRERVARPDKHDQDDQGDQGDQHAGGRSREGARKWADAALVSHGVATSPEQGFWQ
jgi:hypothetical protein